MLKLISKLHAKFIQDDNGATAIEYGLIAVGIALAIVGVVGAVGSDLSGAFKEVSSGLQTASE